jgi:glycine oxidase
VPELLVLGDGPWGLAIAWRAARLGAEVALVSGAEPPAAWVAAGMLAPWSEAADGEEGLHRLMLRALARWPRFADDLAAAAGEDPGVGGRGALMVAARAEHVPLVRHHRERLARLGHDVAWSAGSALRDAEPGLGPSVSGGLLLPDESAVDPRALLGALASACSRAGVEQVRGPAAALLRRPDGRVCGAALADGRHVEAGRVVLAAGVGCPPLAPRVPIRPVKGQILRLRPRDGASAPLEHTVRTPAVYLLPRASGEVVAGATVEEAGDRDVLAGAVHELLDEAVQVVPDVREMVLAESAAGLRPATPDGLPAIGPDPEDDLLWATGGYRHGVLLTPLAAEVTLAALGRTAPDPDAELLRPDRFPAPVPCA